MKALRLKKPREFEIAEIERPSPGEGQVLVKIEAASICNQHDMRQWDGEAGRYPAEYGFPGHEGAGVIVETGPGVEGIRKADHVATSGIGGEPLYREFVLRRADAVARVSNKTIAFPHLAPLELFGCVRRAIEWADRLACKRVAVMGLGPAGLAAVMLLRVEAPSEIVGIDLSEKRRARGLEIGADRVLDGNESLGLHEAAGRLASGKPEADDKALLAAADQLGIDVVIDCTGSARALETSFLLAHREVVVFGFVPEETRCFPAAWFRRELTIRNSRILSLDNLRTVARLTSAGQINPGSLVTHVLPFSRYDEALALVRSGEAVKVALVWDE